MWNPDFAGRPLPESSFYFRHNTHGTLKVKRLTKGAGNQINFRLKLTPPAGPVIREVCHLAVDDDDHHAYQPPIIGLRGQAPAPAVGASSVGYGDIDLRNMTGMRIIYVVHYVFAITGSEIGVAKFVVESIVNANLATVCQQSGMRFAPIPSAYEGTCYGVRTGSWLKAYQHGWRIV